MSLQKYRNLRQHLRWTCLLVVCLVLIPWQSLEAAEGPYSAFRIGFSYSLFENINRNDARAAIGILAKTVARQKDIPTDPQSLLFNNSAEMVTALRSKAVDMVVVSVIEYELLQKEFDFGTILLPARNDGVGEEYLLVAHREGPVQSLGDLAGRSVLFHHSFLQCLAPLWLDNLLVERGFAAVDSFVGKTGHDENLTQVLLPVFFKQADACVVSRQSLEMTAELNPQLGRKLAILESSKKMIPMVVAFRQDYAPPYYQDLLEVLRHLHESEEGRQIMAIFKMNKFVNLSRSYMDPSLELISSHTRLNKIRTSR